ncbi:glycoside hydrolase family 2 TIM barrel-domain containing protein [Nakamurella sp. UYEF19]|uniref:glycoside hydrolase family 2 TIM barrel-domain containing protein n=1 Tax=Nakamurella sp. UYEF19 TaxID=1756392 RepID=UPI00339693BA
MQGTLDDGTRTVSFNDDWRFALVNSQDITDPTGAYARAADPGYDDTTWDAVKLPHDWSIGLDPVAEAGTDSGTGFLQGGLGWYRKTFTLPKADAGKQITVEFDGVYMDSSVYVNGTLAAAHPYGYTGFSVDLTTLAHTGGTPNVIAVKVQNKLPSSRWYSGSGIYRNTHLTVTAPVHVARWGTYVTTPTLEADLAQRRGVAHVETTISNDGKRNAATTVVTTVLDATGKPVGKASSKFTLPVGQQTVPATIPVSRPHLWSTGDPYLYRVRTDVKVGSATVDSTTTSFGFRYYDIDPNQGMTLNGKHLKLQGVDLHHDQGALGSATNMDALRRELTIMKNMGVNAFRTSHNPPSPEIMQLCDEMGIVVMVEAFDTWHTPKRTYDYGRFFDANSDSDIKEMVYAHRNSPSVILWSIGNEIPDSTSAAGLTISKKLIADIKAVDDTRPVVIGSDKYRSVPSPTSATAQILNNLDGLGLNYNTAKSVDALHAAFPTKFLFESESSSETSTRGSYQDPAYPNTGENYTPGKRNASSYDNNLASWTMSGEYGLKKDRDRKYFLGEFLWSGFDYIGEPTPYDVFPVKSSYFGAVDTAGFPKDMFYLFQSQWSPTPMVHLLPMNWTDYQPGQPVSVWAYSNADTVELFLNGKSLGVRTFDHKTTTDGRSYLETTEPTGDDKTFPGGSYTSPNGSTGKLHLAWNVPFEAGTLEAVATRNGKVIATDKLTTAGRATTTSLTPDRAAIPADGRSLSYITVDVVDKAGTMVPDADDPLHFSVTGGGTLVGLDNGRQESAENYKSSDRSAFNGKALAIVQSNGSAEPITVTVTGANLTPQSTTIFPTRTSSEATVGIQPVHVRVAIGGTPTLPKKITAVAANGRTSALPVVWKKTGSWAEPGTHRIIGKVTGSKLAATAVVTVYDVQDIGWYAGTTVVGVAPLLPGTIRVGYTDGYQADTAVEWNRPAATDLTAGHTVTVTGKLVGTHYRASARIEVVAAGAPTDIASQGSAFESSADASYSGAGDTVPAALLDDSATTAWSNYYNKSATALLPAVSKANAADWVSVSWPAAHTVSSATAAFTVTAGRYAAPQTTQVQFWDGAAWSAVTGLTTTPGAAAGDPTVFAFDPVNTTQLRLTMTSAAPGASDGFVRISRLEVLADPVG